MQVGLKLILIVLLALRITPTAAASIVISPDFGLHYPQQKEKLQTPAGNHACMVQEQESIQTASHFRWPLLVPYLRATRFSLDPRQTALKVNDGGTGVVSINAFYRSLLFPAHFFR